MNSDPGACLLGPPAGDALLSGSHASSCYGTRRHVPHRGSNAMVGCRQGEFHRGSGGLGFRSSGKSVSSRRDRYGGAFLVVRFQTSTNNEAQQQVNDDERAWRPLGVSHKIGEMVGEKYRILGVLGQGGVGTTYEAEIVEDGTTVALKALSLRNMKVWKDLELFEREARVLRSLRHPNIPEYIDYFEVDTSSDRAFYIAQKVARGLSLAELVQSGGRFTEQEVVWIGIEILEVLDYLGSLRPPVYHRDIKPENVILDNEARSVKVVDFGAVQDAASVTLIGSTVIGTYGYMAPEQFQNRATSQTDLYGLGGTLLFLLSGRNPSFFPQKRLKVDFSSVTMSPRLAAVVDRLLEPAPEDRFQAPMDAIKALKSVNEPTIPMELMNSNGYAAGLKLGERQGFGFGQKRPTGTKVDLRRSAEGLEITIPPGGLSAETVGTGTFAVAWNAMIAVWTKLAWSQGVFAIFSLPFWFVGIMLARRTVSQVSVTVKLKVDEQDFAIEWGVGNFWTHKVAGNTADITSAEVVVDAMQNGRPMTTCRIVEGVNVHNFGSGLELVEKTWIVQEIRNFLGFPPEDPGQMVRLQQRRGRRRPRRWDRWDDNDDDDDPF